MISALFYTPGSALVLGLLVFVGILAVGRLRARAAVSAEFVVRAGTVRAAEDQIARRGRFLRRLSLVAPWAILAPFVVIEASALVPTLLRYMAPDWAESLVSDPLEVRWWVYAVCPAAGAVCLAITLGVVAGVRVRPEVAVTPVIRRGWAHFVSQRHAVVAISALVLFVFTSLVSGLASGPDDNGWFSRIEIPGEEGGTGSSTFFGWAYSLPALAVIGALTALVVASLRIDSFRPFVRPETVVAESDSRRVTAALLTRLYTATVLLTLGSAWLLIGDAGTGWTGVGIPGVGVFTFHLGYSSFAPAFVVAGVGLQTAAVVLLLLTISGRWRLDRKPVKPERISSDVAA